MSTPSAKTVSKGGPAKTTTTTTTVVKTTTTTTTKQPQLVSTRGAGVKAKRATTTASGKKVVNSHSNRLLNNNGLMRFSRGRMFHRRALYRISKWKGAQAQLQGNKTQKTAGSIQKKKKQRTPALTKKPVGGDRNGKERLVRAKRFPRYYPTETAPKKFAVKRKHFADHPRRFRSTLTPGTVVILVAGKHAGKRVVVVKQLSSGLLLVTGPQKLNGVSLRRVNQIYVIATNTKLDLSASNFENLDDKFFKRVRTAKKSAEKDIFNTQQQQKPKLSEERVQAQRNADTAVLNAIKANADSRLLRSYLKSRFQLWNGVLPHKLKF